MYTILNTQGLGASGRQNEMIELALTHNFDGIEVDMVDLLGRHDTMGKEFACQFLQSAKIDMGTFELPIDISADDATYKSQTEKIDTILDLANTLGAKRCYLPIKTSHASLAFQENFDQHRTRLVELGDRFGAKDVKIGLLLQASKPGKEEHKFIQQAEELLTLIRTVGNPNVGLCLNTWEWAIGKGAMDQIAELDLSLITEVRLADLSADADITAIKSSDRELAGESKESFSLKVMQHLVANNFPGSVAIATDAGMFKGAARNRIVGNMRTRLQNMIEGVDFHAVEVVEDEGEASEASVESTDQTPVATAEAAVVAKT